MLRKLPMLGILQRHLSFPLTDSGASGDLEKRGWRFSFFRMWAGALWTGHFQSLGKHPGIEQSAKSPSVNENKQRFESKSRFKEHAVHWDFPRSVLALMLSFSCHLLLSLFSGIINMCF